MPNRLYKTLAAIFLLSICVVPILKGQLVGGNGYIQSSYVELGVGPCGVYGCNGATPAGYHANVAAGLGFRCDVQRNGWTVGTPGACGDYFMPGSPVEGWALTFNGIDYINTNAGCPTFNVPGAVTKVVNTPAADTIEWTGGIAGVTVLQRAIIPGDSLYIFTEVLICNTTASTVNNVFYGRNLDPDNDQTFTGSFVTTNIIISQPNPPAILDALVASTGATGLCYLGLGSHDARARVNIGGFGTVPADDLYNGVGRTTSVGSSTTGDIANGIGFSLGNLAPGECTCLNFTYLMDPAAVSSALSGTFSNPLLYADGAFIGSSGTLNTCKGDTILLSITGATDTNWVWSCNVPMLDSIGLNTSVVADTSLVITAVGTSDRMCGILFDTLTLTVNTSLNITADAGPDVVSCVGSGDTLHVTASGGVAPYTAIWSPPTGLSCTICTSPLANPPTPTTYTVYVTDAYGCQASDTVQFLTSDTVAPAIGCPPTRFVECWDQTTVVAAGSATYIDACLATLSHTDSLVGTRCNGVLHRTWTATDGGGNFSSCVHVINIADTTPPTVNCPVPLSFECIDSFPAPFPPLLLWSDNCDPAPVAVLASETVTGRGCTGSPRVLTRTYSVTDSCGNTTNCVHVITVQDTTPPVVTCPPNLSFSCVDSFPAPFPASLTWTDNCDPAPVAALASETLTGSGCASSPQVLTRTYTITDSCDNVSTCVHTITVVDSTAPLLTCPPTLTVTCTDEVPLPGVGTFFVNDNCGTPTLTLSSETHLGGSGCQGDPHALVRVYTATDSCGNSSTCLHDIIVEAPALLASPTITQPTCIGANDGTITLNPSGGCGAHSVIWSHGPTTLSLTGLAPGTYTYTLHDAWSCFVVDSITLLEPAAVEAFAGCCNDTILQPGDSICIPVLFSGAGPWELTTLENGIPKVTTHGTAESCYSVTPAVTTTIEFIGVRNPLTDCLGSACGKLTVAVEDCPAAGAEGVCLGGSMEQMTTGDTCTTYTLALGCDNACFDESSNRVPICHNSPYGYWTIYVTPDEVPQHLAHGDLPGHCSQVCPDCPLSQAARGFADVSIPCGNLSSFSNSLGLPMEAITLDSLSGITGLRIWDVPECGMENGLVTVQYTVCNTVCADNPACLPLLAFGRQGCRHYEMASDISLQESASLSGDLYLDMQVYPNPTQGNVSVVVWCNNCGTVYADEPLTLQVWNDLGQELVQVPFTVTACNVYQADVDLSIYADGMYFLEVRGAEDQLVKKILKE